MRYDANYNIGHDPTAQLDRLDQQEPEIFEGFRKETSSFEGDAHLHKAFIDGAHPKDVARFEKIYQATAQWPLEQPEVEEPEEPLEEAEATEVASEEKAEPDEVNQEVTQPDETETRDEENSFEDDRRDRHHEASSHRGGQQEVVSQPNRNPLELNLLGYRELPGYFENYGDQHLFTEEGPRVGNHPADFVNEVADKLLNRLLVSDPTTSEKREVRLMFNEDFLPGTEVQLEHVQGVLEVRLTTTDASQRRTLNQMKAELQAHLSEALGEEVVVLLMDEALDEDHDAAELANRFNR